MNPLALLRMLTSGVPAKDHTVSVNGERKGPVTEAVAAIEGAAVVFRYKFDNDGNSDSIDAFCALADAGKRGGSSDQIMYNNEEVDGDDILISGRFTLSGPVAVVEFVFQRNGEPFRIRFDARKRW